MVIFVTSPPGFTCSHTNFNGYSSRFAWHWSHPSNPRRVSRAPIQILMVSHRDGVGRKDIHPKTCQVSDSSNKWESDFWSVSVGAYYIRPSTFRVWDSSYKVESNFWSVRVGMYCIRPSTYRVWDSSSKVESNFWSVCVGEYCIHPSTYRADQSFVHQDGHSCSVCNKPLHVQSNTCRG